MATYLLIICTLAVNKVLLIHKTNGAQLFCAFALLVLGVGDSARGASSLGDRALVEINGVSYTQRQMECYVLAREGLRDSKSGIVPRPVSMENWREAFAAFNNDIIILQEAQKVGSFSASQRTIEAAITLARENLRKSPAAQERMQSLQLESNTFAKVVGWVLRVESFRQSKERQESAGAKDWFKELQARSVVRSYKGADHYESLRFPGGS